MRQVLMIFTAITMGIFILAFMISSAALEIIGNLFDVLAHKIAAAYERFEKIVYGYK